MECRWKKVPAVHVLFRIYAEYDLGLFIGFVGIIIFISQRKHINPDIKRYVYSGIVLFILSLIAFSVYIAISLSSFIGSLAIYQHGSEISGKYFVQYFFNYYFYSIAILIIVALISYILISYKFLIGHKLPFIAGLIVPSALDILYTDVYLLSLKGTMGNLYDIRMQEIRATITRIAEE